MSVYPPKDIERAAVGSIPRARIACVLPESPADDAGFVPGCFVTSVDGHPVRDLIDWRWLTADDVITLGYIDLDGDAGEVELDREPGEEWGIEFDDVIFDAVKQCRNACTFCFMRQLPHGMRPSLSLRDDDFRLSFLSGTFVTFTNLSAADEARIIEQHISPLRMSLHAIDPVVRTRLIGKHAQHGIDVMERLLAAGIEFHTQIVLVPGENDGEQLEKTLAWAYARPGIANVGIVPLGFTKHQGYFEESFNDPAASRGVLRTIAPFQERALAERDTPWVFAADEFYRNAYGEHLLENLPPTSHYGDFSLFEDGIGIIRSYVDDWEMAHAVGKSRNLGQPCEQGGSCAMGEVGSPAEGKSRARGVSCASETGEPGFPVGASMAQTCAAALRAANLRARYIVGGAMQPFLGQLVAESPLAEVFEPLVVRNDFFGGNVDVTGLLCGCDIVHAVVACEAVPPGLDCRGAKKAPGQRGEDGSDGGEPFAAPRPDALYSNAARPGVPRSLFLVPRVIFNDDGVTLDDMSLEDMEKAAGTRLHVVSCNPSDFLPETTALCRQ